MNFDWHGGPITRATVIDKGYKNTQNARRFLVEQCGADFKFDRDFMAWIRNGTAKTMGDVANEWLARRVSSSSISPCSPDSATSTSSPP